MRSELKKNIFHLAWSPDSLPASQAAAPLLDCLDHILLDLEPNLLPDAFHRCVAAIWDVLLVELWAQAEVSSGVSPALLFAGQRFDRTIFFLLLCVCNDTGQVLQILRPIARGASDDRQFPTRRR